MRVSQQMLFTQYVTNMNTSLTELIELNLQAQTQKKINKPSDDPAGMVRVMEHRDTLARIDQYQENISTAQGWLKTADQNLLQVSTVLTRLKELGTQASTGTLSADNREQISYEARALFDQLLGLANQKYEDKSIYSGHKTDSNTYDKILWQTTNDDQFLADTEFTVEGNADKTVMVQFYQNGVAAGTDANLSACQVRYSIDGGETFLNDGTITTAGGVIRVNMPQSGTAVTYHNPAVTVRTSDENDYNNSDGTWVWLRPSARYMGDLRETVKVDTYGNNVQNINAEAGGTFSTNVTVRIDNTSAVGLGDTLEYSYSMDGGLNWITGNTIPATGVASNAVLTLSPQGTLTLTSNSGGAGVSLAPGTQFVVRPSSAAIDVDISSTESVMINNVGFEVFGGVVQDPDILLDAQGQRITLGSSNAQVAFSNSGSANMLVGSNNGSATTQNLFEAVGNLVAMLETNNQDGVQRALENIVQVHKHIENMAASVGGRENRLNVAENILSGTELNEKERLSEVEDVDIAELMTQLTQQQIAYESVLKSSSMIMNTNLLKYI